MEIIATPACRHRVTFGQIPRLALPLAMLLGGCAMATPSNPRTAETEYYRDAQLCRAQNPVASKTRSTAAGGIVDDVDKAGYLQCMERLGWQQDAKTDPLLKALERCRQKVEHPGKAAKKSGGAKPGSGLDRAVFRECLKQRGFEYEAGPSEITEPK